jgi:alpha-L-rhamnosidase
MFDVSRLPSGLTQPRYPSRVIQIIPPFSLWWVAMVHDYALWRDDLDLVRALMPRVRGVLDRFHQFQNADGLVEAPLGWNFTDWAAEWGWGVPPDGEVGVSGVINWHFALVLTLAARLEEWLGEPELATRAHARAAALAARLIERFWDEERGLFADDLQYQHYSEHAQCRAILSGLLDAERQSRMADGLLGQADLTRTTIYFSHYLFETYVGLDRIDALIERMELWFELPALGFTTTPEQPEPSRLDCHVWGAHPLYHYFASVLGIRPTSPGFATVTFHPQLGSLTYARGTLVHPRGKIAVDLRVGEDGLHGRITLPPGVIGRLQVGERLYTIEQDIYEF